MANPFQPDHLRTAAELIEKIDAVAAASVSDGNDPQALVMIHQAQLHLLMSIAESLNSLYQHGIDISGGRLSVDS